MCKCPVPGHGKGRGDRHPSLHVSVGRQHPVIFHCKAGCSQDAAIDALRSRGLWPSRPTGKVERYQPKRTTADEPDETERIKEASEIWATAEALDIEPIAYFKWRGIETVPDNAMYLPRKEVRRLLGKGYPAVIFPVTKGDRFRGIGATFLTADDTKNLKGRNGKSKRQFRGPVRGGYIKLGECDGFVALEQRFQILEQHDRVRLVVIDPRQGLGREPALSRPNAGGGLGDCQ
jgi:hypothetical protein